MWWEDTLDSDSNSNYNSDSDFESDDEDNDDLMNVNSKDTTKKSNTLNEKHTVDNTNSDDKDDELAATTPSGG